MSQPRDFVIFTADGARHSVSAPTLRTALRNSGLIESKSAIVAAVEAGCLPLRPLEDRPFCAVFLSNPNFIPPPEPE